MTFTYRMRATVAVAVLAGLALRSFFIFKFPVTDTGDAPFYIELAWNWLKNGVYGFPINGHLAPVDMRVPGYPAFLAAIFSFVGPSSRAVMLTQAVIDLATCFLIALMAARLAPDSSRRPVALHRRIPSSSPCLIFYAPKVSPQTPRPRSRRARPRRFAPESPGHDPRR